MPFDSNGTFNRVIPGGWKADAAAGIKITALRHDDEDDGFATGLSTCITKDGRTQPTANIPLNGKKLINVGEPTNPADAATKNYVDNFKTFTTGATISGAGPINGFLHFSSPTGVNGIGWATADMSWVGKLDEALKFSKRLAVNNMKDGTGNDVFFIDETGRINTTGVFSTNASYDGTTWRTIGLGKGTIMTLTGGDFTLQTNDTATTVDFQSFTPRTFFSVTGQSTVSLESETSAILRLSKKDTAGASFMNAVRGYAGSELRWDMRLGDGAVESATWVGSNFYLLTYDNTGANGRSAMHIARDTLYTTFYSYVFSSNGFVSNTNTNIIAASGSGYIYFRPNGYTNASGQTYIDYQGGVHHAGHLYMEPATSYGIYAGAGLMGKNGISGGYVGNWHNFIYSGGYVYCLVDNTNMGAIQMVCDYRTKRNIKPLPSLWEKVKGLKPISYQPKKYGELFEDMEETRWGFVAHELQRDLVPTAALGVKDDPGQMQSPNLMAVCAALTKALQEAMERIEALEAKVAA